MSLNRNYKKKIIKCNEDAQIESRSKFKFVYKRLYEMNKEMHTSKGAATLADSIQGPSMNCWLVFRMVSMS